MADLVTDSVTYPGEVWYFLSDEDDPYPESTFIDSEGRNKRIVLRIRPLEDDDYDWGIELENPESWYFPIAIELSPLEGDYYPQSGVLHAAGTAEILRGIQLYNGILYCALIYTFEEDNDHNYYIAIHKTEMKGKISGMPAYEDTPTYPTEGDTYTTGFGKLNRIIQSHEEVTARALLDLNARVLALGSGGGSGGGGIQEITWSALKTLKDGGNLTPGQLYRITDYTCTTTQTDTQSAGHVFDIIVLALSELVHVYNIRDNKKSLFKGKIFNNKVLVGATIVSATLMFIILLIPSLRNIFSIPVLPMDNIIETAILVFSPILFVEIFKLFKINGKD